ncbi:polysaccharide biosynthesis C-terminal domain-containing protein [Halovenus rubra]|uniref:Polysaccharide biosynthesis C-terminal domain-containing protein n=2 Tax=Halovenus rubra TaxID=869890 RepID=A0ABD5XAT3_9EURY|nr:polysaccharide biosynthesis C-terminal domain-containing protein [Halovenus rubra]
MAESRTKFILDFLVSTLPKLINKLRGIILIPIVTKILGQSAYGLWTNFAIGLTLLSGIASLSLGAATNKLLVEASDKQLREEFWAIITVTTVSASFLGGILVVFQNQFAAIVFGGTDQSDLVVILAAVLVLSLLTRQSTQFYRSQRRMGIFAGVKSVRSIVELLVITVAAIRFESILEIFISYLAFHVVLSACFMGYVVLDFGIARPNFARMGQYIRFGLPLVATGMMYWVVNVSDRYLITYFHSVEATGGYAVVYATASGLSIFSMAIGTVLFPDLASLRQANETAEYRHRLNTVLRYFFLITIPAAAGLIAITEPLLRVVSTADILKYADLMYLLAPAMVVYGVFNILIQSLLSDGRSRTSAMLWGAVASVNLGGNLLLVPAYSATGASVATLASFVSGLCIVIFWRRQVIVLSFGLLVKIIAASVLMGGVVFSVQAFISAPYVLLLPVLIGTGVLVYGICALLFGVITKEDLLGMKHFAEQHLS